MSGNRRPEDEFFDDIEAEEARLPKNRSRPNWKLPRRKVTATGRCRLQ